MRDHIGLSLNLCYNRWLKNISNFSWKDGFYLKSLYEVCGNFCICEGSNRKIRTCADMLNHSRKHVTLMLSCSLTDYTTIYSQSVSKSRRESLAAWKDRDSIQSKEVLGWAHTRQSILCPSTFDPRSPVCLTSASALYRPQAQYTSLPPARLEEVYFDTVQFTLAHKHTNTVLTWPIANAAILLCNSSTTTLAIYNRMTVNSHKVGEVTVTSSVLFSSVQHRSLRFRMTYSNVCVPMGWCMWWTWPCSGTVRGRAMRVQASRDLGIWCVRAWARYWTTGLVWMPLTLGWISQVDVLSISWCW